MDEKIFRKENRADEDLSDFCIFWFQFLLKNHYLTWINEESPKIKIYFSEGLGGGGGSSHLFSKLGGGGLYKSLVNLFEKICYNIASFAIFLRIFSKYSKAVPLPEKNPPYARAYLTITNSRSFKLFTTVYIKDMYRKLICKLFNLFYINSRINFNHYGISYQTHDNRFRWERTNSAFGIEISISNHFSGDILSRPLESSRRAPV